MSYRIKSNFELICVETNVEPMTYGHDLNNVMHVHSTDTSENERVHGIHTAMESYYSTNRTEGYVSLMYGTDGFAQYALYVFKMEEEEKFKKVLDGSIPTYLSSVITEGEHNERKKC